MFALTNSYVLCGVAVVANQIVGQIPQYEVASLQQRAHIESGILEISLETQLFGPRGEQTAKHSLVRVWFDGENMRSDVIDVAGAGDREVKCINGDYHLYWTDYASENKEVAVTRHERNDDQTWPRFALKHRPVDPRLIGMAPNTYRNLSRYKIDSIVGSPIRANVVTIEKVIDGVPCMVTEFQRYGNTNFKIAFATEKGFNVIFMEVAVPKTRDRDVLSTEYRMHEPSGKWYPSSYRFTRYRDGRVDRQEHASIKVASLNEPIDSEVFELQGIELAPGKVVATADFSEKKTVHEYWDGEKLVPDRLTAIDTAETKDRRWWIAGAAIAALLVAALLLFLRRRSPMANNLKE